MTDQHPKWKKIATGKRKNTFSQTAWHRIVAIETMGGFDVQPEHWKLLVKRIISNPAMIVPTYENPT